MLSVDADPSSLEFSLGELTQDDYDPRLILSDCDLEAKNMFAGSQQDNIDPLLEGGDRKTVCMAFLATHLPKFRPEKSNTDTISALSNAVYGEVNERSYGDDTQAIREFVDSAFPRLPRAKEITCLWARRQMSRVAGEVAVTPRHQAALAIHSETEDLSQNYSRRLVLEEFGHRIDCGVGKRRGGCQYALLLRCLLDLRLQIRAHAAVFTFVNIQKLVSTSLSAPRFSEETLRTAFVCILASNDRSIDPPRLFDSFCKAVSLCLYFEQTQSPLPLAEAGDNPSLFLRICAARVQLHEGCVVQRGAVITAGEAVWRWILRQACIHGLAWPGGDWHQLV